MGAEQQLTGTVSGVQNRTEVHGGGSSSSASSVSILVFRLTPQDGARPVHVEMRGSRINGTVVEGETVDAYGSYKRNGLFRARRVVSHETDLTVDTKIPTLLLVAYWVCLVVVLAFLAFIAFLLITDSAEEYLSGPGSRLCSGCA